MSIKKIVTFDLQGVVKALRCIYTNHRKETRIRNLQPLSIHYGFDDYHPYEQWFLSCLDLERRNQNETEGARSYPLASIIALSDDFVDGGELPKVTLPPLKELYAQQPKPTETDDRTDWDEPKIFIQVVQMKHGQKFESTKQIQAHGYIYNYGGTFRAATLGEIDNALAEVRQAVRLLLQK